MPAGAFLYFTVYLPPAMLKAQRRRGHYYAASFSIIHFRFSFLNRQMAGEAQLCPLSQLFPFFSLPQADHIAVNSCYKHAVIGYGNPVPGRCARQFYLADDAAIGF